MKTKWSQCKEKCCRLGECHNWIWILIVVLESVFSWIKYGTYHKAVADKSSNDCQEYVFNMHGSNCDLYGWYIGQSVAFGVLFLIHLIVKRKQNTKNKNGHDENTEKKNKNGGDDTCSIAKICGLTTDRPTYIKQFLFPHLLILANFVTECIIENQNHAYIVQIITDLFGYLLFFSFMNHGGHFVEEIMSPQKEKSRVPKEQYDGFLALNIFTCIWVHLEIVWYMFSKLDEDYHWTEITHANRNENFEWSKADMFD